MSEGGHVRRDQRERRPLTLPLVAAKTTGSGERSNHMLRFQFKPRHPITRVAFTLDGRVVTAQPFTGIAVRDRLTGEAQVRVALQKSAEIYQVTVHPVLGWVVVAASEGYKVCDVVAGVELSLVEETPDGARFRSQLVFRNSVWWRDTEQKVQLNTRVRSNPTVAVFAATAALRSPLRQRHLFNNNAVTFAPNGTKLALCDGDTLGVFDLAALETATNKVFVLDPLFTLERPDPTRHGSHADRTAEHWLPPVAFDHAGRTLLTLGLRNRVQRIDLATGGVIAEWGWRCEPIRSLAVAPDGLTAAAGCKMGELVVWDLE